MSPDSVPDELTAAAAVAATAAPILEFTRGWMLHPDTAKRGEELGLLPGRGFWVCGRNGVLGDVDADVVAHAIGFMESATVRRFWQHRPQGQRAHELANEYAACAYRWAGPALKAVPQADLVRLNGLGRKLADAALAQLGALFAGWRAMAQPDNPAEAVTLTMHVLREWRGSAHLSAVMGSGMHPLEAALSAPAPRGGPKWVKDLGWAEPYPDPARSALRRTMAEAQTSVLCLPAFEELSPHERAELTRLILQLRAAIEL
ncbi:MAG: SCO6745 family protein [Acidimicrobiales bacterium]